MRIPTQWLNEYCESGLSATDLADLLTGLGIEIEEIIEVDGEPVLVAEITPNRGDCLSLYGLAREVSAATGQPLREPEITVPESAVETIVGRCEVVVEAPDLCPRYAARLVLGVTPGPSPEWLQKRLRACGQRPIDILVDVTNYVLFELGQPLHAFDYDRLGPRIGVRRATDCETIVTLDGVKRSLTPEQLLITNGVEGVALAGVMGGSNTEVDETTRNVLLEAAHFQPANIRRTARSLGLESESSYRFARTVDPNLPPRALDRAAQLLAECAGGTVARGIVDVKEAEFAPPLITLRPARCNRFLGTALSREQMAGYLTALGLTVAEAGENLAVTVPTRRPDLTREVDLIEEIARLHGYNRIPVTIPPAAPRTGRLSARQRLERRIREILLGCGLTEVWTFSLTSRQAQRRANLDAEPAEIGAVVLANALSEEYSLLRWSMLPSMLEVLSRNAAVHAEPLRIFEIGRTYAGLDPRVTDAAAEAAGRRATGRTATALPTPAIEETTLAGALCGRRLSNAWNIPEETLQADFYEAKGLLELLAAELRLEDLVAEPCAEAVFEPGRAARLRSGGRIVGVVGEVARELLDRYDLRGPATLFELNLGWLLGQARLDRKYVPVPNLPPVLRDLALVVDEETPAARLQAVIAEAAGEWLEALEVFDVYRGQGLPADRRSIAWRLRFRHPRRTLTDDEVDAVVARIIEAVGREFGAALRE